jgi:hypothetical protein
MCLAAGDEKDTVKHVNWSTKVRSSFYNSITTTTTTTTIIP